MKNINRINPLSEQVPFEGQETTKPTNSSTKKKTPKPKFVFILREEEEENERKLRSKRSTVWKNRKEDLRKLTESIELIPGVSAKEFANRLNFYDLFPGASAHFRNTAFAEVMKVYQLALNKKEREDISAGITPSNQSLEPTERDEPINDVQLTEMITELVKEEQEVRKPAETVVKKKQTLKEFVDENMKNFKYLSSEEARKSMENRFRELYFQSQELDDEGTEETLPFPQRDKFAKRVFETNPDLFRGREAREKEKRLNKERRMNDWPDSTQKSKEGIPSKDSKSTLSKITAENCRFINGKPYDQVMAGDISTLHLIEENLRPMSNDKLVFQTIQDIFEKEPDDQRNRKVTVFGYPVQMVSYDELDLEQDQLTVAVFCPEQFIAKLFGNAVRSGNTRKTTAKITFTESDPVSFPVTLDREPRVNRFKLIISLKKLNTE